MGRGERLTHRAPGMTFGVYLKSSVGFFERDGLCIAPPELQKEPPQFDHDGGELRAHRH